MIDSTFDVHEQPHRRKRLAVSGDSKRFENRDDVACPECVNQFSQMFPT